MNEGRPGAGLMLSVPFCLRERFSENPLRQEGCVHFAGGGV